MLFEVPHYFLDPEEVGDDGVYLSADIFMGHTLRDLSDKQIQAELLNVVQEIDHFEYYWKHSAMPKLRHCVAFEAVCSQDIDVCHHVDTTNLRRRYQRMGEFDCKGKVYGFINRKYNWINLNVVHHIDHERPEVMESRMIRATPMSEAIKEFINTQLDIHNINAINLYEKVVARFGYVVNRGQVSTAWRQGFEASYKKCDDQLESCRLLVQSLHQDSDCEEVSSGATITVGQMMVGS